MLRPFISPRPGIARKIPDPVLFDCIQDTAKGEIVSKNSFWDIPLHGVRQSQRRQPLPASTCPSGNADANDSCLTGWR
jgi:hypothetical protein